MEKSATLLFAIAIVCAFHGTTHAAAQSELAASMQPEQWKEFITKNLSNDTLLYMNANSELWYTDMSTTRTNYLAWNTDFRLRQRQPKSGPAGTRTTL